LGAFVGSGVGAGGRLGSGGAGRAPTGTPGSGVGAGFFSIGSGAADLAFLATRIRESCSVVMPSDRLTLLNPMVSSQDRFPRLSE